jgi:hypothetical protein
MMKRIVVGAHHKTGSVLSWEIVNLLIEFIPGRPADAVRVTDLPNWMRKLPLSYALKHSPKAVFARSMWFEHEIDVPGIKFLHFVRRPMPRLASAYLFHKRGAPTDAMRWADWRIFDFNGRKSYVEVLNALDVRDGLLVEAIRTYPEAVGSARAYASAAGLPADQNLPVWLDRFEDRPLDSLSAIFQFVYGDADSRLGDFLAKAESRQIVLKDDSSALRRGHVTRNDASRRTVEATIGSSAEIAHLYADIAQKMGPSPTTSPTLAGGEPGLLAELDSNISDIFDDIKSKTHILSLSPGRVQSSKKFWRDPDASAVWQTFALSNFANGHLMMQPFIQTLLSRLA